ncbi:hypothetical protein SADUNF_Sadunf07G0028400 [Salix dunnii]|uniref:Uncharacterized protein n=1 Tax=Salix dunnii TaxID=1413687 RepID=A0A835K4F5_9ROSI|nr:hypothetical protein SADUNF_Sadunf07G0028400 [Salix dunnii]
MDSIRVLVIKLQIEIESLLHNTDIAIREEDAVELVIDEIKKKMAMFMESIKVLASRADKCNRDISQARTVILNRILKYADQYLDSKFRRGINYSQPFLAITRVVDDGLQFKVQAYPRRTLRGGCPAISGRSLLPQGTANKFQ